MSAGRSDIRLIGKKVVIHFFLMRSHFKISFFGSELSCRSHPKSCSLPSKAVGLVRQLWGALSQVKPRVFKDLFHCQSQHQTRLAGVFLPLLAGLSGFSHCGVWCLFIRGYGTGLVSIFPLVGQGRACQVRSGQGRGAVWGQGRLGDAFILYEFFTYIKFLI